MLKKMFFSGEVDENFLRRFEYQIFCGPPSKPELVQLLKYFSSEFGSAVTDQQFESIAKVILGVTQDYAKTLTKMAYHNCIKKVLEAENFFRPNGSLEVLPCPPSFIGSFSLSYTDIPQQLRGVPPIVYEDYQAALGPFQSNPSDGYVFDISEYKEFARRMGKNSMQCINFPI